MSRENKKLILLAVMAGIMLLLLFTFAAAEDQDGRITLTKDPYGDEMLIYGNPAAMPTQNDQYFRNEYIGAQTEITARRLLQMIEVEGNEYAFTFASKLGLGTREAEVIANLRMMVDEYDNEISKGNTDFTEPRFVINGVNIVMNKTVEQVRLTRNSDGTYNASLTGGGQTGYRTSIMIDADASITIVYDENGQTQIERRVSNGKPTDFVINLDVSGSMNNYGRSEAMFQALKVVLDEILQVEENTVSIVFWANEAAVMQLDVGGGRIQQVFSGSDGVTITELYNASMVGTNGSMSNITLSDATINQIENLYHTGSQTEPDKGLTQALALLNGLTLDNGRNIGVMLFTDGTVVPDDWWTDPEDIEKHTVELEKQMVGQYNATLVNVSLGDEYEVSQYERYLDPTSPNYYDQDSNLDKNILYYNIPKLSNQELADKVSEVFEVAFESMGTEYRALRTETITDGILAAYGAQLIETIPAGFELVQIKGEDASYIINGVDANGNTTISFNLDKIVAGKDKVLSYCVIPTNGANDIGVAAYASQTDTVLYAKPIDRINYLEEEQLVSIRITATNTNQEFPQRSVIPEGIPDDFLFLYTIQPLADNRFNTDTNTEENRVSGQDEWEYMINFCKWLKDGGFSIEFVEKCARALGRCENERLREMYLMLFSRDGIVECDLRSELDGTTDFSSSQGVKGNNGNNQIYIIFNSNTVGNNDKVRTIFHELGHAMDTYVAGTKDDNAKYTARGDRATAVCNDVENHVHSTVEELVNNTFPNATDADKNTYIDYLTYKLMKNNVHNGQEASDIYSFDELDTNIQIALNSIETTAVDMYRNKKVVASENEDTYQRVVSDVFGGVTNNYLTDGMGHYVKNNKYGDSSTYWYDKQQNWSFKNRKICEIWAEYCESVIDNLNDPEGVINEFFPSFQIDDTLVTMHRMMADDIMN